MKKRMGPQQNRADHCTFNEEDAERLRKIINRHGSIERARVALDMGKSTMDAARACGRTTKPTRARVLEAMALEEGRAA